VFELGGLMGPPGGAFDLLDHSFDAIGGRSSNRRKQRKW
jgi:hypothetical protein